MAFGGLQSIDVGDKFFPEALERVAEPFARIQVAAEASRD